MRIHKSLLAIGLGLSVASIFFPISTDFSHLIIHVDPGPYRGPQQAVKVAFWSFMHVQETLSKVEDAWVVTNVQWLSFAQYWNWWGPGGGTILPSTILIPTFVAQIAAVCLCLATLLKANAAKEILPALLAALTLNALYFAVNQVFGAQVFVGFWLSILSTVPIVGALIYTRFSKRAPSPMHTSELRGNSLDSKAQISLSRRSSNERSTETSGKRLRVRLPERCHHAVPQAEIG